MKFEIDDIITIDEDDYYVANKIDKNSESYVFLIKTNEKEDLLEEFDILLLNSDNTLSEVIDDLLFASLYEEFIGNLKSENL